MKTSDVNRTVSLRPGKSISVASLIFMIFMFFFGIGFAVIIMGVLHDNDAPLSAIIVVCIFMAGWILTTLYMIVYHFMNLKRSKGMPMIDVDMDSVIPDEKTTSDFPIRLRSLEKLRADGLITQEEHIQKRAQILADKW